MMSHKKSHLDGYRDSWHTKKKVTIQDVCGPAWLRTHSRCPPNSANPRPSALSPYWVGWVVTGPKERLASDPPKLSPGTFRGSIPGRELCQLPRLSGLCV